MNWLAQLSFSQALRWALVWPTLIVIGALAAITFVVATRSSGEWAFAVEVGPHRLLPAWLAVSLVVTAVLVGPSVVFLTLWTLARR